jgi:two-component system, OmpR family, copper resistance phosphate regulon response regulator CusR
VASLLLIEDTPVVLNLLHRGLREAGYEVDTASDASTGLERCLRGRYDLVVTDFSLTAVGGIGLLQQLHTLRTAVPLVVITGRDRAEVLHAVETAGLAGVVTILQKPFSLAELTRVVGDALASAPQADQSGAQS